MNFTARINILLVICTVLLPGIAVAQSQIAWIGFEEYLQDEAMRAKDTDKKVFLEIYIDRCKWCEKMDQVTLKNGRVKKTLESRFVPTRLDGRMKKALEFKGKKYKFVPRGKRGYHGLTKELAKRGKLSQLKYPAIVILDSDLNVIQMLTGYKTPDELQRILLFFGDDHYKSLSWEEFNRGIE